MTESLKETMIRMAKAYNLDVPEFLTEIGGQTVELRAEIEELRKDLKLATDIIEQQLGEIERLNGVVASYERDRLFEAGKGKIGSL